MSPLDYHQRGWNAAIDAAAGVLSRVIEGMKAHTNADGMVTGADFFFTELAYLEPVLQDVLALKTDREPQSTATLGDIPK